MLRFLEDGWLEDNASGFFVDQVHDRLQIVVIEYVSQISNDLRNTVISRARSDVPVVPAVIAATQNLVAICISSRKPNRRTCYIRARLAEPDHLRLWQDVAQELRDFDFERMHQRKCYSVFELCFDRFVNPIVAIAKRNGAYTHGEIYVLVTVDIPNVRTLSALNVLWSNSSDVLPGSLC